MELPVFPSLAFEVYGPFWYEIDAPRHIFLHFAKSLALLAKKAGLSVMAFTHRANGYALPVSRLYQMGIPFFALPSDKRELSQCFSARQLEDFEAVSLFCEQSGRAERAMVILGHAPLPAGGGRAPLKELLALCGGMEEALRFLKNAAKRGTLQENAALLDDIAAGCKALQAQLGALLKIQETP